MSPIRIDEWFQGPSGSGQGGWTAARFVERIGQPATIAIRAAIPLDTDLTVVEADDHWLLVDGRGANRTTILEARRWEPEFATTEPLSLTDARAARKRFPLPGELHPAPHCFSCGVQPDAMHVHAGPLNDGRFASDWSVPDWAVRDDGTVDDAVVWAAIDCAAAMFVCCEGGLRPAHTVQYAVEVLEPLEAGATYALVAWPGDWQGRWEGRKRGAASAAFAADGTCVARSRSFWVAVA